MSATVVLRAVAIGLAAGSRASLGVAAPALASSGTPAVRAAAALAVAGELVGDKLPVTPSRLELGGPAARAVSGAVGGARVARRRHAGPVGTLVAVLCGTGGALLGTGLGAAWRAAVARRGRPDLQGALVEDAVALTLAGWATRTPRRLSAG